MASLIYLAPVLGIVALLFAFVLAGKVNKMDEGTDRMQEIAASIREGARAFLSGRIQNSGYLRSCTVYSGWLRRKAGLQQSASLLVQSSPHWQASSV